MLRRFTPFTSFADGPAFVVERDGEPVAYQGRMVKYAPPSADDFLTLAPGQARTVSVDLGALYDFSQPGTYTVRLRAAAQEARCAPPWERRAPRASGRAR